MMWLYKNNPTDNDYHSRYCKPH